jgi:hypothetical protein
LLLFRGVTPQLTKKKKKKKKKKGNNTQIPARALATDATGHGGYPTPVTAGSSRFCDDLTFRLVEVLNMKVFPFLEL